ncbi:MAG TPA: GGDEF domain-containing protein [Candidatus Acidoferrales bacterium]|nr:GGDEF domain-containing protein [Candidatus Acidoferrales bacterium]
MGQFGTRIASFCQRLRWLLGAMGVTGLLVLTWWVRHISFSSDPLLYTYLELVGSLLSFTYAANALVRFRGTHDRLPLILAFGFVLSGLIETASTFGFNSLLAARPEAQLHVPLAWMVSRTLLGVLLLAALVIERRVPNAREPGREIAAAFLVVGAVAYLTSVAYLGVLAEPTIRPAAFITRPWDLFPAGIFLVAAVGFRRRLRIAASTFDRTLFWAVSLNVACHVLASQSQRLLDAPFTAAQILKVLSYALVLGGALLDNARLFEQVRTMAVSDPLTGLANYRRLLDVLQGEIQRSRRSGRPFAVLLLDLDGLKTVNDRYGHLVGSRALCRLANVLRVHCRAVDTAARYGGDEFALVLPEASRDAAACVARRICERLATDGETPVVSVSAGASVFPEDGDTIEKLLGAADRALYGMKRRGTGIRDFTRIAACL